MQTFSWDLIYGHTKCINSHDLRSGSLCRYSLVLGDALGTLSKKVREGGGANGISRTGRFMEVLTGPKVGFGMTGGSWLVFKGDW